MNLRILYALAMLTLSTGVEAQISTHIDGYGDVGQPGSRSECPRPFIGTFDFVKLPAPLQEAEVNFALTALKPSTIDWEVSVWALRSENRVDIVGDSVHVWSGPINVGDQFSGTIKFVPLASGVTSLDVGALIFGGVECGLTFTWCLSEDGELLYLGNSEIEPGQKVDCDALTTFFFPTDSVYMTVAPSSKVGAPFGHDIVIRPVPRIGDTSYITFELIANSDFPDGADFSVASTGLHVFSVPGPLSEPIVKGQHLDLTVGVVPLAVNVVEELRLHVFEDLSLFPRTPSRSFKADFIFDNEGNLRYTTLLGFSSPGRERAPTAHRPYKSSDYGKVTIWKSGIVQRKGQAVRDAVVGADN